MAVLEKDEPLRRRRLQATGFSIRHLKPDAKPCGKVHPFCTAL
jgi:hypothetical protein